MADPLRLLAHRAHPRPAPNLARTPRIISVKVYVVYLVIYDSG